MSNKYSGFGSTPRETPQSQSAASGSTGIWGKVKDRANVIKASFDELETAVVKATNHDLVPPKEKHVQSLIQYTNTDARDAHRFLSAQLKNPDWIVVMKTLVVYHRLMREGSSQFAKFVSDDRGLFNMSSFMDNSDPAAYEPSLCVRKYSRYLEEKVCIAAALNRDIVRDVGSFETFCTQASSDVVVKSCSHIYSLLKELIAATPNGDCVRLEPVRAAYVLLMKDSLMIYKSLNNAMMVVLDRFFHLGLREAEQGLVSFTEFADITDRLNTFYAGARNIPGLPDNALPELKMAKSSGTVLQGLRNYIDSLKNGNSGEDSIRPVVSLDGAAARSAQGAAIDRASSLFDDSAFAAADDDVSVSDESESAEEAFGHPSNDPFGSDTFGQAVPQSDPFGFEPVKTTKVAPPSPTVTRGGLLSGPPQERAAHARGRSSTSFDTPSPQPKQVQPRASPAPAVAQAQAPVSRRSASDDLASVFSTSLSVSPQPQQTAQSSNFDLLAPEVKPQKVSSDQKVANVTAILSSLGQQKYAPAQPQPQMMQPMPGAWAAYPPQAQPMYMMPQGQPIYMMPAAPMQPQAQPQYGMFVNQPASSPPATAPAKDPFVDFFK